MKKKRKLVFPDAITILLIIAVVVAGLTWFIPSGTYEMLSYNEQQSEFVRTGGMDDAIYPATQQTLDDLGIKIPLEKFTSGDIWKPVGIPGTYRVVDANPQGVIALLQSPIKGMTDAIDVILFVLIIGGFIGIVHQTGAFDVGVKSLATALEGREYLLIVVITILISIGGTTFGLAEETIAFYPILVPIFLAAGYDAMVPLAAIFLGSSMGTTASTVNPFSSIIASDSAGINWTSGITGRMILLVIGTGICIWYIMRYAKKVKEDPSKSIIYDQKTQMEEMFLHQDEKVNHRTKSHINIILFVFALCFVVMVYGVSNLDWWFMEMTTVFFTGSIIIGILGRLKEIEMVEAFVRGARDLLGVALIIGFARGVTILLDDGMISDTLLYYSSLLVENMPAPLFTNTMMYLYAGLSFFVPSSSGMAVLTMPIFAPLADVVGIGREHVVDAYQTGMGLFAFINPTSLILASLAIVKIGYDKWLRWVMPLILILLVVFMVFHAISPLVGV